MIDRASWIKEDADWACVAGMAVIAAIIFAHLAWCARHRCYHARNVRVERAHNPIQYYLWMGTNVTLGALATFLSISCFVQLR